MITVEKLEKGTYFDDAFKISFRYDPTTVAKVKELAERRYLPEDRAWEIPAHELPALIEKVGLSNIKSEEAVVQALNTKEIEDKREATQERLKGIKPVRDFDFKTAPLPHQIEAFNYGMEKNSLLIGDEQGLGKTKESIDICVARKKELIKTLIVCGVNSVKYNWEKEIQIHSNEGCVMVDGKTMDVRVQQLNDWYRGSSYFGVINIESLRNEKIQDALYLGIKDGYIGAIIVDEIHKAKNGGSQQGKALRFLKAPVKIGLSGTPMNKAEDLWNILTWLGVERRSFYSFRNAYCTMGGFGGYKVIGYKNLNDLNAELNTVMLRRKKEEVLDLPPKLYSTEYVELTTAQKKQYRDIKNGIVADMENILASVNPLNCTLRLRQLTSGNPNLKVEFSRNVPNNLTEIVDTVTKLDGKVDKETLLSLLPFIDNPKEVLEKLDADKERDRQNTDPYSTQNITEDSNYLFPNLNAQNSRQEALNAQGATIPQPEQ